MKKIITLVLLIGLYSGNLFGQSKADLTLKIDSLTKANTVLKKKLDSVTVYTIPYKEIRKRIIRYDYKPTDFPKILDTILLRRDSTALGVKVLNDSLSHLVVQNHAQKEEIDRLKYFVEQFVGGNGILPANAKDLIGIWGINVFGFKVIGDTARSGLVADALTNTDKLIQINLIDAEFAEVQFSGGEVVKCFYKINAFSTTAPYYIDFNKGEELNLRLYINHTDTGMKVSYKGKSNTLLYGFMKRK